MPTTTPSKNTSTKRQRQRTGPSPAHYDFVLVVIVASLIGLGMVMIFSASYVQANNLYGKSAFYFLRQLQWLAVSVIAMVVAAMIDFRILKRLALLLMAGTVIICAAITVTLISSLPIVPVIGRLMIATLIVALLSNLLILPANILTLEGLKQRLFRK